MIRRVATGGALGLALLTGSWASIVVALIVVLVPTLAVCWVLADRDRPARFALLLAAWHRDRSS